MVGCLQYPNPISYYTIRYYIEYGQYGRYYTIHVQYIYIYICICIYVIFQYQKMVPMYMTCHILYHIVSLLYVCVKSACPGLLKPWPHVAAARHRGCQQSLRTAMHLPWVFWEQRVQWCQHWVEDGQTGPIKLKTSKQLKKKTTFVWVLNLNP